MTENNTPSFPVAGPLLARSPEPLAKRFSAAGPAAVIVARPHPSMPDAVERPAREAGEGPGPR